jgi:hypothetical protein
VDLLLLGTWRCPWDGDARDEQDQGGGDGVTRRPSPLAGTVLLVGGGRRSAAAADGLLVGAAMKKRARWRWRSRDARKKRGGGASYQGRRGGNRGR